MKILLPPRLRVISDLVRPGADVCDVGSDHGLLPAYLAETGRFGRITATDIAAAPLGRAKALFAERNISIETLLTDGLPVEPPKSDKFDVIIAGMGGESIARIVAPLKNPGSRWSGDGIRFILQPMSRAEALREALSDAFIITDEVLVMDNARIFAILRARARRRGEKTEPDPLYEPFLGGALYKASDPLFPRYAEIYLRKLEKQICGIVRSHVGKPTSAAQITELRRRAALAEEQIRISIIY